MTYYFFQKRGGTTSVLSSRYYIVWGESITPKKLNSLENKVNPAISTKLMLWGFSTRRNLISTTIKERKKETIEDLDMISVDESIDTNIIGHKNQNFSNRWYIFIFKLVTSKITVAVCFPWTWVTRHNRLVWTFKSWDREHITRWSSNSSIQSWIVFRRSWMNCVHWFSPSLTFPNILRK